MSEIDTPNDPALSPVNLVNRIEGRPEGQDLGVFVEIAARKSEAIHEARRTLDAPAPPGSILEALPRTLAASTVVTAAGLAPDPEPSRDVFAAGIRTSNLDDVRAALEKELAESRAREGRVPAFPAGLMQRVGELENAIRQLRSKHVNPSGWDLAFYREALGEPDPLASAPVAHAPRTEHDEIKTLASRVARVESIEARVERLEKQIAGRHA